MRFDKLLNLQYEEKKEHEEDEQKNNQSMYYYIKMSENLLFDAEKELLHQIESILVQIMINKIDPPLENETNKKKLSGLMELINTRLLQIDEERQIWNLHQFSDNYNVTNQVEKEYTVEYVENKVKA